MGSQTIGVDDFVDSELQTDRIIHEPDTQHQQEPKQPEHLFSTVTETEDTVLQPIELRMPNTKHQEWAALCLDMKMPLQATTTFQNLQQPEGRSRMISLSWNDQTLSKPQRCSPKP